MLRTVSARYRDRAQAAIAALERFRASKKGIAVSPSQSAEAGMALHDNTASDRGDQLLVGTIVVYRPPGDRRATPCRIEKLEVGRAYLVPCPRPDIGWIALDDLIPLDPRDAPMEQNLSDT